MSDKSLEFTEVIEISPDPTLYRLGVSPPITRH